jgi:hypothetical protein
MDSIALIVLRLFRLVMALFVPSDASHERRVPPDGAPSELSRRVDACCAIAQQEKSFHRSKSAPLNGIRNW